MVALRILAVGFLCFAIPVNLAIAGTAARLIKEWSKYRVPCQTEWDDESMRMAACEKEGLIAKELNILGYIWE